MAYQLNYTGTEVNRRLDLAGNIPTKVSDLTNDSGFITKSVNDLVNYYLKSETYTKAQVESLIAAISQFRYVVVATLPTASADTMNKIYLVPSDNPETQNVKDEYITLENDGVYTWEQIGSTAIDLSDYVTETQLNTALAGYVQKLTSVPEGNLAVVDSTGGIKDGGIGIAELAKVVSGDGIAAYLVDTQSAGTEQNFTFRQSGGDGVANYKTIKGRTLVWNQLLSRNAASTNVQGVTVTWDGSYMMNISGTASSTGGRTTWLSRVDRPIRIVSGHKYVFYAPVNADISWFLTSYSNSSNWIAPTANAIFTANKNISDALLGVNISTANVEISASGHILLSDLTAMFGAGYEPATVAEFEALYNAAYYAQNNGTLLPFKGTGLQAGGFNLFDGEWLIDHYWDDNGVLQSLSGNTCNKNHVSVFPSTVYYCYKLETGSIRIKYFDNAGNYLGYNQLSNSGEFTTPANTAYLLFNYAGYAAPTVGINRSDPAINGQYFPYEERTLSLPIIGKTAKDAGGNPIVPFPTGMHGTPAVYDVATKDGGEKKWVDKVDLSTLTWSVRYTGSINKAISANVPGVYRTKTAQFIYDKHPYCGSIGGATHLQNPDAKDVGLYSYYNEPTDANEKIIYLVIPINETPSGYITHTAATPVPFTWDTPLDTYIPVDELGTEKLLPEGVDTNGVPKTSPFRADTTYSISIANLVRKLNALSNE